MALAGSSSFTVSDQPTAHGIDGVAPIVVWLRGEHDISTDGALRQVLARAIALDPSGIVLDLSEVKFVGASTLGVIVAARELFGRQSRSLTVRSPSPFVRRIIGVCALDDLFGPSPEKGHGERGEALASWVAVPASEGGDLETRPLSTLAPDHLPAHLGHAADLVEQAPVEHKQLADIA